MRQSTVDALDEADRLYAQMSWLLFTQEQDRRLFGYSPILWEPGEPVVPYVRLQASDGSTRLRPVSEQAIRNLFDIFDDASWVQEYYNYYNRCRQCKVWWATADPCWVCGEHREPMTQTWRKLMAFYRSLGQDPTEEKIDEALTLVTQRAEEQRQRRREQFKKMQENMDRNIEIARSTMDTFGQRVRQMVPDFETYGWPIRQEFHNDGHAGYRRWQLVIPRNSGRAMLESWTTQFEEIWQKAIKGPDVSIFVKTPFVMPDISRRYDPYSRRFEPYWPHPTLKLHRTTRIMISRYAYGQVPKLTPIIKEPKIDLGNPQLETYLAREEARNADRGHRTNRTGTQRRNDHASSIGRASRTSMRRSRG